ncbi:MAG: prephenate dehydratase [Bacteroidales bacterium]
MTQQVAIQGIQGAFHEIAARTYFGNTVSCTYCDSFKEVFQSVQSNTCEYGIVAIENTVAGSLLQNYHLLKESKAKIIGEVSLHITQNLMVLPGTSIDDITEVYSHPIAIAQSKDFFEHKPSVKLIEWSDTASSAKKIAHEKLPHAAAIASTYAAELYGLEIIAPEIETHKKNYTRFLVISRQCEKNNQNNKTSLCFETGHQPGALADVLQIFKHNSINLTKIQSLPILGHPYLYAFYADIEWKERSNYDKVLTEVLQVVSNLSVLGEYKRDEQFNHEILN